MKIRLTTISSLLYAYIIFLLSLVFLSYYTEGDQYIYTLMYKFSPIFESFSSAYDYYQSKSTASEPIYFILIYLLSPVIDKNILIAFLNALITFFLTKWMLKKQVNPFVILSIMFNYYLWVLFLPAERLKLGLLFLLLGALSQGKSKYFLYLMSVLSHFQSILMLACLETSKTVRDISEKKNMVRLFVAALAVVSIGVVFYENIILKLIFYHNAFGGVHGAIKPVVFMGLALYCARSQYKSVILSFAPVILLSIIVGSDRLTIFAYFIFMYHALQYNRGLNIPVLITLTYFNVKGLLFLNTIVMHGDGFYKG